MASEMSAQDFARQVEGMLSDLGCPEDHTLRLEARRHATAPSADYARGMEAAAKVAEEWWRNVGKGNPQDEIRSALLPADQPAPGKYDDVLRPFVSMMEAELHANSGKGNRPGWLAMDGKTCLLEIYYHLGKLQKAAKNGDLDGVREYSADVANMSMMLADIFGVLEVGPDQPTPAMDVHGKEGTCDECGCEYPVWFAPNHLWNLAMGGPEATDDPGGMLCPTCFMKRAEAAGAVPTAWEVRPERAMDVREAARVLADNTPNPVFDTLKPVLMGEHHLTLTGQDDQGDEFSYQEPVPWTVQKEIIRDALAALAKDPTTPEAT